MNQKQRYMVVMAQNLYFHAMADNRGVMIKLADRAAEEDVKEEMLLYSVLAKETAQRKDMPAIDAAIEQYLTVELRRHRRLRPRGCPRSPDRRRLGEGGGRRTPRHAFPARRRAAPRRTWDVFLDNLPDVGASRARSSRAMPRAPATARARSSDAAFVPELRV